MDRGDGLLGDNLNDLHMMQVVGHPVAPENARPEILAIAETVIGHHATGSVLRYMEEIVWVRFPWLRWI